MIEEACVKVYGNVPAGDWPAGNYGADGSGGSNGSDRFLRKCGSGIARVCLTDGRLAFDWGLASNLPGSRQTVPRAELFAIILLIERLDSGHSVVYSDSWITILLFP